MIENKAIGVAQPGLNYNGGFLRAAPTDPGLGLEFDPELLTRAAPVKA